MRAYVCFHVTLRTLSHPNHFVGVKSKRGAFMDSGAQKLLESVTIRTLHAQNFSRSSTQASLVLTDLLARYLTLLTSTCAKYAEHAGRKRITAKDAVAVLEELGVSVEELHEFGTTEGVELNRYALFKSLRRVEDLKEFKG